MQSPLIFEYGDKAVVAKQSPIKCYAYDEALQRRENIDEFRALKDTYSASRTQTWKTVTGDSDTGSQTVDD